MWGLGVLRVQVIRLLGLLMQRVETEMRARTTDFAKKDNAIAALQSELRDTRSDLQATLAFLEVEVLAQPSNHTV